MDWTTIIYAIGSGIMGLDLGRFLFFRQDKRHKEAENKDLEIETMRKAVESVSMQNDSLTAQNKDLIDQLANKDATIEKKDELLELKNNQIDELTTSMNSLYGLMCAHKGCRLREPLEGQGKNWFLKYKDDSSLGCDFESVDTLMKRDRRKRNKENLEGKKTTDSELTESVE